ncbi:Acetyltransferase (GNAT) family protein [Pseudomonas syringae]|nr:Acetyltransferase (GNAT) family protein [Pseudomonas syringae]SFL42642.1 Acetyltransferase (GNAT) family protein [Pseudomonas syringae]
MPDRGRTYRRRQRALTTDASTTEALTLRTLPPASVPASRPKPADASAEHHWLMRRNLDDSLPQIRWPTDVVVTPFILDLAAEAHRLLTSGYLGGAGNVPDYSTWLAGFEHDAEYDLSLCFLAMRNGAVIGVITGWTSAFIKDLVVHPDARNRGVGFALLHHLFAHLTRRHEAAADLYVMENNLAARRLYEKSGMSYVKRIAIPAS